MWRKVIDRENKRDIQDQWKIQKGEKKVKETGKHGETKKKNMWMEDEQKEGIKRQSRRSKRKRVALVVVKVKSYKKNKRKFQNKSTQILNEKKVFRNEVEKTESGREHRFFLFF